MGPRLKTSRLGNDVLSYNKTRSFELNRKQKDKLVKSCFLEDKLSKEIVSLLRQFRVDYLGKNIFWSELEDAPLKADKNFIQLLLQANLLIRKEGSLSVNKDYYTLVLDLVSEARHAVTEDDLINRLEGQKELGRIAEKIVLKFEKDRLYSNKFQKESELVKVISFVDVGAGYDILSFNGETDSMEYDRFIEVKGSSEREVSFVLSRNEVEVSKKLGSKYWIYFIGDIDAESKSSSSTPIMIQDPFTKIFKERLFSTECTSFLIRQKPKTVNRLPGLLNTRKSD